MASGTTFKVTQGHDQKEATVSPDRRDRSSGVRLNTPNAVAANGGTNHSTAVEQRLPPTYGHTGAPYSQPAGIEWNRAREGVRGWDVGGASTKFQALAIHDHKGSVKIGRTSSNQLLNKFTDFFLQTPPSQGNSARSPSPWGGPDLSQAEPESQQSPPPPPPLSPTGAPISRQDQKRMTLGHSKLDLVNQYNHRMKGKQVYSRFELKTNN